MVNMFKRMRRLNTRLLQVRTGTGAAILPSLASSTKEHPPVTRIHLTYAQKAIGGHQGARHFWRKCLPRMKYHNPAIQMTVQRTEEQEGPAALTIFFSGEASSAASANAANISDKHAPAPLPTENPVTIDAKDLDYKEIWQRVMAVTGAEEIPTTLEDQAELDKLEKICAKAEIDRKRVDAIQQGKKDQERMLREARGEVERLRQL